MRKIFLLFIAVLTFVGILSGCGNNNAASDEKIIIGYFPNINHVPAMVAKENGTFQKYLGDGTAIEYRTFADGSSFMLALTTGEIHAGLVGPGPAMNYYSTGADVKIIAGGSTGGTVVLAREGSGINSVDDFPGKSFITPRVGCTHDVQAETYLKKLGIMSNRIGGTMNHLTGKPAQYVQMFLAGKVDIAVAPEPWASVLELETGAKVIIDTNEISFGETLPASVLVTSGEVITNNPALIQKIVDAHMEATAFINENPKEAKAITLKAIKEITGQELSKEIIDSAWNRIGFTYEVNETAIQAFADSSYHLNFLQEQPDFSDFINQQFIKQ